MTNTGNTATQTSACRNCGQHVERLNNAGLWRTEDGNGACPNSYYHQAAISVDTYRATVRDADVAWREAGWATDGGSRAGWGLDGE